MKNNDEKNSVLGSIAERTVEFLAEDMKIKLKAEDFEITNPTKIELRQYTAVIGISGAMSYMFIMSLDSIALDVLTEAFAYGEVSTDEIEFFKDSVICEVANTVLGNSLKNFPWGGAGVNISPPINIEYGKAISKTQTSTIAAANIQTEKGSILLALIGPDKPTFETWR